MQIFVTKHLFTAGIQVMEAEAPDDRYPGMAFVRADRSIVGSCDHYFHGKEWHTSRFNAVEHARAMKERKLAALDKQRRKIDAMEF